MSQDQLQDQPGKLGIKETEDVVILACVLANYGANWAGFNPATIVDGLAKLAVRGTAAISGIADVPAELKDLDESEKKQLRATVAKTLELSEHVEEIVDAALDAAFTLGRLAQVIRSGNAPLQQADE